MDKKTIIIIIFGIIILSLVGVMAYQYIERYAYNQGIQDATLIINRRILNSLEQNGYVPFVFTEGNETYNIKLGVIQNQNE